MEGLIMVGFLNCVQPLSPRNVANWIFWPWCRWVCFFLLKVALRERGPIAESIPTTSASSGFLWVLLLTIPTRLGAKSSWRTSLMWGSSWSGLLTNWRMMLSWPWSLSCSATA